MDTPPDRLPDIIISHEDVRTDAMKLLADMSAIRAEALADKQVSDAHLAEYRHLAARLAGITRSIADDALERMLTTTGALLDREPLLLSYDTLQDGHWAREQPAFLDTLDAILDTIIGASTAGHRHHILQAVKYIAATGLPTAERTRAHETILPFQPGIPLTPGILALLGPSKISTDGLEAAIESHSNPLPHLLDQLGRLGYTTAYAVIPHQDLARHPCAVPLENALPERPRTRLEDVLGKAITYTAPLSYLILGSLPRRVQRYAEERTGYKSKSGFFYSLAAEGAAGIGGPVALAAATGNWWLAGLAFPGLIHSLIRLSLSAKDDPRDPGAYAYAGPVGSLPAKTLCYPLERVLASRQRRDASLVRVRIPLQPLRTEIL